MLSVRLSIRPSSLCCWVGLWTLPSLPRACWIIHSCQLDPCFILNQWKWCCVSPVYRAEHSVQPSGVLWRQQSAKQLTHCFVLSQVCVCLLQHDYIIECGELTDSPASLWEHFLWNIVSRHFWGDIGMLNAVYSEYSLHWSSVLSMEKEWFTWLFVYWAG